MIYFRSIVHGFIPQNVMLLHVDFRLRFDFTKYAGNVPYSCLSQAHISGAWRNNNKNTADESCAQHRLSINLKY